MVTGFNSMAVNMQDISSLGASTPGVFRDQWPLSRFNWDLCAGVLPICSHIYSAVTPWDLSVLLFTIQKLQFWSGLRFLSRPLLLSERRIPFPSFYLSLTQAYHHSILLSPELGFFLFFFCIFFAQWNSLIEGY